MLNIFHILTYCTSKTSVGPHVDSIKFSGKLICGLSLGSDRLLRLLHVQSSENNTNNSTSADKNSTTSHEYLDYHEHKDVYNRNLKDTNFPLIEAQVKRRSLYIIANDFRYLYTHEILGEHSYHPSVLFSPGDEKAYHRRVSIMFRDALPN